MALAPGLKALAGLKPARRAGPRTPDSWRPRSEAWTRDPWRPKIRIWVRSTLANGGRWLRRRFGAGGPAVDLAEAEDGRRLQTDRL